MEAEFRFGASKAQMACALRATPMVSMQGASALGDIVLCERRYFYFPAGSVRKFSQAFRADELNGSGAIFAETPTVLRVHRILPI